MKYTKTFTLISLFTFALLISNNSTYAVESCKFTRGLELGDEGEDVRCLQKYLNIGEFKIANEGPGSPGKETNTFRDLTKQSVIKWQTANNINPASGYFGPLSQQTYSRLISNATTQVVNQTLKPTTPISQVIDTVSNGSSSQAKAAILKAIEQIKDAENEFEDMADSGANTNSVKDDILDARETFMKAVTSYLSGDYSKAKSYADDAFESAEDAYSDAGGETEGDKIEEKIDEVNKLIDEVEDKINEADDDGDDVKESENLIEDAKDLLDKAEDYLDDRDYDNAEEAIEDAENKAEDAEDAIGDNSRDEADAEEAIQDAKNAIRDAKISFGDAENDNDDTGDAEDFIDEAEELLDEARNEFDDDNFSKAESLAKKAEQKAEDAEDEL